MKLLLEGSLNETLTLKDLLAGILQAEAPGLSVLQLFLPSTEPCGEIFFLGGHYVVGARLPESTILAQEAFNHLLQLKEASFHYQACDSLQALPANDSLKIDLKELIDSWQSALPLSSNELLDKIFDKTESSREGALDIRTSPATTKPAVTKEETDSEQPFQPLNPVPDKSALGFSGVKNEGSVDWNLVNPLLVGGAPGDNAISLIGSVWEEDINATQELRSLTVGRDWQRKLRDLILILVMLLITLIVILCFAWLAMNSPSSNVMPRRFSVHSSTPAKKHTPRKVLPDNH